MAVAVRPSRQAMYAVTSSFAEFFCRNCDSIADAAWQLCARPTHYFVRSLLSSTEYKLDEVSGKGYAHQESRHRITVTICDLWRNSLKSRSLKGRGKLVSKDSKDFTNLKSSIKIISKLFQMINVKDILFCLGGWAYFFLLGFELSIRACSRSLPLLAFLFSQHLSAVRSVSSLLWRSYHIYLLAKHNSSGLWWACVAALSLKDYAVSRQR